MSSSVHVDNTGKDVLILGEDPTQGLNGMTKLSLIAQNQEKRFLLSLQCNGSNSF